MTARTAAALLMIFGGVVIVAISVGSAWYAIANPKWLDAQLAAAGPDVAEQIASILPPEKVTMLVVTCALAGVIEGGLSIVLGWFVGRGRRWAIATSVAVTSFRLALVGLLALAVFAGIALGTPLDATTTISTFVALVVLIATLVFLFVARRRALAPPPPPPLPTSRG